MPDSALYVSQFDVRFLGADGKALAIASPLQGRVIQVSPLRVKSQIYAGFQLHELHLTVEDTPSVIQALMQLGQVKTLKSIAIDVKAATGKNLGTHILGGVRLEDFTLEGMERGKQVIQSTSTVTFVYNTYSWQVTEVQNGC